MRWATHIAAAPPATSVLAPRFIDKTPINYLYLGLIRMALPEARVIHVRRHPMDSCFAMYRTLFRTGYPFSYDLSDLARYYVAYHRLMQHWRKVMPGAFIDVDYESLVGESGARDAADARSTASLEFEPACLEFHKNEAPVATASAAQVRQPLYRSAVARWRGMKRARAAGADAEAGGNRRCVDSPSRIAVLVAFGVAQWGSWQRGRLTRDALLGASGYDAPVDLSEYTPARRRGHAQPEIRGAPHADSQRPQRLQVHIRRRELSRSEASRRRRAAGIRFRVRAGRCGPDSGASRHDSRATILRGRSSSSRGGCGMWRRMAAIRAHRCRSRWRNATRTACTTAC